MPKVDTGIIKAGMAIVISNGCYSDYSFGAIYIALKDFNYMDEAKKCYFEYLDSQKRENLDEFWYIFDGNFENYLIKNGFIGLCDYREIHTGDYDFFNEHIWKDEYKKLRNIKD